MDCIGDRTLVTLLVERLCVSPAGTFLVYEDEDGGISERTYKEFVEAVARLAGGVARLGIGPESKVCVHMTNRPEFLTMWFALAATRAVMVPSNVWNTAREMEYVLGRSNAEWVVTEPQFSSFFAEEVLPACPKVRGVIVTGATPDVADDGRGRWLRLADLYDEPGDLERYGARPTDLMELLFTSGTTSRPKAAMLTHANGIWCGLEAAKQLVLTPTDRNLTSLPLFHVNAQGVALGTMTVGATLILLQRFSASRYMEQMRRHCATTVSMVPSLLRIVMAQPPTAHDREHKLRFVKYAINVSDAERQAFEERFGVPLVNGYGLSETFVSVAAAPVYGDRRWPSVGLPLIGREIRITDETGGEVARGEVGEISIKGVPGRNIMLGYYEDPEATAEAIRDGWLFTGDLGYMDGQGYLYFHGRKKDMIKRGGENVSAAEVELVLTSHPNVLDVAVIGVADPVHDVAVKAFVVCRDPTATTAAELVAFCQERLAKFKVPSLIEFRDSLPKTSIGKIEKKRLREEEEGRRSGEISEGADA